VAAPATELVTSAVLAGTITRPPRSLWKDAWWQFRRHHLAMVALGTLGFLIVFTLFNDPRSRFLRRGEARSAPADASVAGPVRQALHATLPSTVGVSALAAVALPFEPTLSAFLGGISTGLGVAGALYALRADPTLYVEPRSGVVYRR